MNRVSGEERICAWLIAVLLLLNFLSIFGSWAASVIGYHVGDLLSEEGLRWLFRWWASPSLLRHAVVLASVVMSLGALQSCGLRYVRRHPWSLLTAVLFLLVMLLPVYMLVLRPEAPLQSINGRLESSPFLLGITFLLGLIVTFSAILYGLLSGHLRSWYACCEVLFSGLRRYAPWVVVWLIAEQLYHSLAFIII